MVEIVDKFLNMGISRGGIYLFKALDALMIVSEYRDMGIKILGIDGFIIGEDFTQPTLEHSIDLSINNSGDCFQQAEQFLRQHVESGVYFEIVTEKHQVT